MNVKLLEFRELTNVGEIVDADFFDHVKAGIQVRRLLWQRGNTYYKWKDLLAVH